MKMKRVSHRQRRQKADEDRVTLADNSSLQIASLAEPESEAASWRRLHHNFGGRTCQNRCHAVLPGDETSQGQAVVIEPPKMPDPIHPQTIVGQSIDDLGTSLGLPDFERNDADVVIWQYRLAACVTDFYLYRMVMTMSLRAGPGVRHSSTRRWMRKVASNRSARCLTPTLQAVLSL